MNELQRILQPQRLHTKCGPPEGTETAPETPSGEGETYEDYRARRWASNRAVKQALKGILVWDSSRKTVKDREGKST